jgi:hypothetical protein
MNTIQFYSMLGLIAIACGFTYYYISKDIDEGDYIISKRIKF